MNGFEKYNLEHSSASQINLYANAPCAWAAKYLFGAKFGFSLAARAGVLTEEAVVNVLARGWGADKAIAEAVAAYNKAGAFGMSSAEESRGDGIPGMIENALAALKPYGEPEFERDLGGIKQKKVELLCNGDGWQLPIIGYLDFYFPKHGIIFDLKTTMRLPSVMSEEHMRQGAIYKQAMGNNAVKFLYVSPKKSVVHDVLDTQPVLSEIKSILNRQEKLLHLDAETIRSVIPVIASSYYWGDDAQIRKEIYNV